MENPFLKRATEVLHDDAAFLSVVSAEPIRYFLKEPSEKDVLYDRLVIVLGTPGSGKTTLARVFTYPTLSALLRNKSISSYETLVTTLTECKAVENEKPIVVACRLPMESEYRDIWNFPYSDDSKLALTLTLVQARAVLAWLRHLTATGIELSNIAIVPRDDAAAALDAIGGSTGQGVLARAKTVERALYTIVGALVPPELSDLPDDCTGAYRPFDVIDRIRVADEEGERVLRPLVILDDAQSLHPLQLTGVQERLARRELRIGRWLLTRLDVLKPGDMLELLTHEEAQPPHPGTSTRGDTYPIILQSSIADKEERRRSQQRTAFRKMAKDMANRYLRHMPVFQSRNIENFSDLLSTDSQSLSAKERAKLEALTREAQTKLHITDARRIQLESEVAKYHPGGSPLEGDVALAILNILMHRYAKRTPQRDLFDPKSDPDPPKPLNVDSAVYDAARVQLHHAFDRPYFFGVDDLCDASSENADIFLKLAAALADAAATTLIRSKNAVLDARTQDVQLRHRAEELISGWDFPQANPVRKLVSRIAESCVRQALTPNAWLDGGPNSYGILQDDFDRIPIRHSGLATLLHYALAYNALMIVPRYKCKDKMWCLLELGGLAILKNGLTLKRGGFIEGTADELARWAEGAA